MSLLGQWGREDLAPPTAGFLTDGWRETTPLPSTSLPGLGTVQSLALESSVWRGLIDGTVTYREERHGSV